MTTEEKKKELQNIIQFADEELTNVLMEAAAEYQVISKEEFVVPKEWMDEFEQRSQALDNGTDKGSNPYDTINTVRQQLDAFKKQRGHALIK